MAESNQAAQNSPVGNNSAGNNPATDNPAPAGAGVNTADVNPSGATTGGGFSLVDIFNRGNQLKELAMPIGVMCVLVLLLLPLAPWVLDISLVISIAFGFLILLTVMLVTSPLELNSFPTILLISTMLRLGLNVASTRLILSEGHNGTGAAGDVIQAFGQFLTGGNYVTGIIIFIILVIINFVVITKGAGRIAEVAARFTLDAMPGKQLAIDADLSAGLIEESEAKSRRKGLEQESNFYGSMDGASKFVRGDAIAGLLITIINIIGGIIIGVAQGGLSFGEAAETYTILTVGDGLVSQIPALVISIAAGFLVTKANTDTENSQSVIGKQLGGNYKALWLLTGILFVLGAMVPQMPTFPFLLIASITGSFAFIAMRKARLAITQAADAEAALAENIESEETEESKEGNISQTLQIDHIRLELGYGLLSLINKDTDQQLPAQIKALRKSLASDYGFVMPAVRIHDNLQLPANSYGILVKEIEVARADLRPNMILSMDPNGDKITLSGEDTKDPIFGLDAKWISAQNRDEAIFRGLTVVDNTTIITTHLTELIKDNMGDLLSYSETQKLLNTLSESHDDFVKEMIPGKFDIGLLTTVLRSLLNERTSIRDLSTIMEAMADAKAATRSVMLMVEHVRQRLGRQICHQNQHSDGKLYLVTLTPRWEQNFTEALRGDGEEKQLAIPPSQLHEFMQAIREQFNQVASDHGVTAVLCVSPVLRPYVRSIIERFRPQTIVMSQAEIHPKVMIQTVAQI
ncbi:MAG: flagellar biosynthesis protein FlhA [Alphaproteobacteria bacterium]|nr:flagellar biosynthesis protein FlhA [Alphaproteobacteria bacterium]